MMCGKCDKGFTWTEKYPTKDYTTGKQTHRINCSSALCDWRGIQ